MKKIWTPENDQYVWDHWDKQSDAQMAKALKCSTKRVGKARRALGLLRERRGPCLKGSRTWKPEETVYLEENWGHAPIPAIAAKLNRTEAAITCRANRLGLGAFLDRGEYVTFNQLVIAMGYCSSGFHANGGGPHAWIENRGFPIHHKRVGTNTFKVVYLNEFWKWAEKNRSFLNFSKMEPLALGKEPAWVKEQRKKDRQTLSLCRKDPWSAEEDSRLKMLLAQHKYSWLEMSKLLNRSCGAIRSRIRALGLPDRPIRVPGGGRVGTWTPERFELLAAGIRNGDSYVVIGDTLGISEKAVRGKVYYDYLTEDADKVRAMMGSGPWGTGAPEPLVRQGIYLSKTRTQARKDLTRLAELLLIRREELDRDPYWQKRMCQHWDQVKGCAAGESNCDECVRFQRIEPQYCARCGATFFEREENPFCAACRTAQKKRRDGAT